jgi:PPOX class probable F420-dependent enzyme
MRRTAMATLTDEQAQLFRDRNFAALATIREDGAPQVTPVWVDYDGEHIVFNTAVGRQKERNMRRDPRVTLEVTNPENPYQYVSVRGMAEFEEEGADEMIDRLAKKYMDVDTYPFRTEGEQRVTVKVRPEFVDGM